MITLETENNYFAQGAEYVAGIDEAGRGPLAGPVVAACVIVDRNFNLSSKELEMVADSKKLSQKKREMLFSLIKDSVKVVEISVISNEYVDKINILQASLLAMKKAYEKTLIKADIILVDGNKKIPNLEVKQKTIINGDAKVWVIAAASIIAKVSRDYIMTELDKKYPEYGFAKHKGYGTKYHLEALKEHGPCSIHRQSFAPVRESNKGEVIIRKKRYVIKKIVKF